MIVEVDLRPETKERKTEYATPPPAKDEQWRWTMQKPQIRKKLRINDKAPKTSKHNLWRDVGYMSLEGFLLICKQRKRWKSEKRRKYKLYNM